MKVRRQESEKIVNVGASMEPVKRPRRPHVMAIFSGQTLGCKQCGGDGGGGRSEGESNTADAVLVYGRLYISSNGN